MRKKKKSKEGSTLRVAFIFLLCVTLLILGSLVLKVVFLALVSKFDGVHRFTIELTNAKNNSHAVVSFAPDSHTFSYLTVSSYKGGGKGEIGKVLETPIDGFIKGDISFDDDIKLLMRSFVVNYRNLDTNLTIIDCIRLWIFTQSVPAHSQATKRISLPKDERAIDAISSSLFSDATLSQEKVSIQIVNGAGVFGLGNKLARLITNMGGNVVAVTTSDSPVSTSQISFYHKKTYTLERLSRVLGFKTLENTNSSISDIIVTIGEDSLSKLVF